MTNEQAIKELQESHDIMRNHDIDESESYLMQALNMAIKALQAQADGEKTCGTCRNEDTYHCAECENKSDYEQSQADGDLISRQAVKEAVHTLYQGLKLTRTEDDVQRCINELPSVAIPSADPKKCKDCKWWRDSDGAYRRGVKAESRCPINTVSVANGWGYCYMFEPQESEVRNG